MFKQIWQFVKPKESQAHLCWTKTFKLAIALNLKYIFICKNFYSKQINYINILNMYVFHIEYIKNMHKLKISIYMFMFKLMGSREVSLHAVKHQKADLLVALQRT